MHQGHRTTAVVAFLLAIGLAPPRLLAGQGNGSGGGSASVPELTYENGRVVQDYLPYSKSFVITGSPVTSKGRADVVWGQISERRDTLTTVSASCWVRPKDAASDVRFRTVFESLTLGRRYWVRFTFAQRIDSETISRGVVAGLRDVVNAHENFGRAPSSEEVANGVAEGIKRTVAQELGTRPLYLTVAQEGDCATTDRLDVRIPTADANALLTIAKAHRDKRSAMDDLNLRLREIQAMNATPQLAAPIAAAFRALRSARTNRANTKLLYSLADLQSVEDAFNSASIQSLDAAVQARVASVVNSTLTPPREIEPHSRTLIALFGALDRLRSAETDRKSKTDAATAADTLLKTITPKVESQFVPISEASVVKTSWNDVEAEVRKLQIGTAVSGTAVMFGSRASDHDAAMVAALRFYLAPVDRSLPNPWSSPRARVAVDVGALFQSTLTYRGQEQKPLFNSITPTVGVSYDLTRYLSVAAGSVFFRQPSTNPLAGDKSSHPRVAMYLGLGTDFDALNQLTGLLKKE